MTDTVSYSGTILLDQSIVGPLIKWVDEFPMKVGLIPPLKPGIIAEYRRLWPNSEIYIIDLDKDFSCQPLCHTYEMSISAAVIPKYPPEFIGAIEKYEYHRQDYQEPRSPLESLQKNHKRYKSRRNHK